MPIGTIANGEGGASVRTKLNAAIAKANLVDDLDARIGELATVPNQFGYGDRDNDKAPLVSAGATAVNTGSELVARGFSRGWKGTAADGIRYGGPVIEERPGTILARLLVEFLNGVSQIPPRLFVQRPDYSFDTAGVFTLEEQISSDTASFTISYDNGTNLRGITAGYASTHINGAKVILAGLAFAVTPLIDAVLDTDYPNALSTLATKLQRTAGVVTVANQFGHGKNDNDLAPFRRGFSNAIPCDTSPALAALGFPRGWTSTTGDGIRYGGLAIEERKGYIVARLIVEFLDGQAPVLPRLSTVDANRNDNAQAFFALEDDLGDGIFSYAVAFKSEANVIGVMGGYEDGDVDGSKVVLAGFQFAIVSFPNAEIDPTDYPNVKSTVAYKLDTLTDTRPSPILLCPPALKFIAGRPVPIFAAQVTDQVKIGRAFHVLFMSGEPGTNPFVAEKSGEDTLEIVPERLGLSGVLALRELGLHGNKNLLQMQRLDLSVARPAVIKGASRKVLVIGDSIAALSAWPQRVRDAWISLGGTMTAIGTMSLADNFVTGITPMHGEGRPGWQGSNYTGEVMDAASSSGPVLLVAPGAEAAYLAMSFDDQWARNPFLREAIPADLIARPLQVFGDTTFDLDFYLDRFGYDVPDVVMINLFTNEVRLAPDAATAISRIENSMKCFYAAIREVSSATHVIFVLNSKARALDAAAQQGDYLKLCCRTVIRVAASFDDKVAVVPGYFHVGADLGWESALVVSTDPDTGMTIEENTDALHPREAVNQLAECILPYVAATLPGATDAPAAGEDAPYNNFETVNIASAATCDIGAVNAQSVRITGTTTITSFGTRPNRLRYISFGGAMTLTHGAALDLPGEANIVTVAGDNATAISSASGNWRIVSYSRNGVAP